MHFSKYFTNKTYGFLYGHLGFLGNVSKYPQFIQTENNKLPEQRQYDIITNKQTAVCQITQNLCILILISNFTYSSIKIQTLVYSDIHYPLTSLAPLSSRTSATSVWPFSQAQVKAVSPVPVWACTLAPATKKIVRRRPRCS